MAKKTNPKSPNSNTKKNDNTRTHQEAVIRRCQHHLHPSSSTPPVANAASPSCQQPVTAA
jgi:hypothetical protein